MTLANVWTIEYLSVISDIAQKETHKHLVLAQALEFFVSTKLGGLFA